VRDFLPCWSGPGSIAHTRQGAFKPGETAESLRIEIDAYESEMWPSLRMCQRQSDGRDCHDRIRRRSWCRRRGTALASPRTIRDEVRRLRKRKSTTK